MVYRNDSHSTVVNKNMRGGDGSVIIKHLLDKERLYDKGRLFAQLTVKKGCSIGTHRHDGEMEAFYILSGTASFNDNGTQTVLYPGDVAYTADGESHSIANNGEENCVLIALIINSFTN
jgi:mannose-6-phosphate isomerase-like protein (cupin superfamily)